MNIYLLTVKTCSTFWADVNMRFGKALPQYGTQSSIELLRGVRDEELTGTSSVNLE